MPFWRKIGNFEKENPDWRKYEDTSKAKKKFPNFENFIKAHNGPSWKWSRRVKRYLSGYEPWVEFKRNESSEIVQVTELFNRFFLGRFFKGQYFPDPDHVLIRHLFAEVSDRGIYTIDCEGYLLHEKYELLAGLKIFKNVERMWKAISEEGVLGNENYYSRVHSKAIEIEYAMYQHMGEKIIGEKLPFKAFLYAHPGCEAMGWPPRKVLEGYYKYNPAYLKEPITREQLIRAADVFEIGGYQYIDKERMINIGLE